VSYASVNDDDGFRQRPRAIGYPLLAWLAILAMVSLIVLLPRLRHKQQHDPEAGKGAQYMLEMQCKYFVGAAGLPGVNGSQLYQEAGAFNAGPPELRARFVVLAGELKDAKEASKLLHELTEKLNSHKVELSAEQLHVWTALRQLYKDYEQQLWDAPSLAEADRTVLRNELGWFGRLALAPAQGSDVDARKAVLAPTQRTVIAFVTAGLVALAMGVAGLVGLVMLIVLMVSGVIGSRLNAGSPLGGVYAETFAVWMLLFLVLGLAAALIPWDEGMLLLNTASFFLSLTALAWPVLRGAPWRQVRHEIGWTGGRTPWLEPLWGLVCYASTLPLLLIGFLLTLALMAISGLLPGSGTANEFGPLQTPSHPIIQWISESGWPGRLQVLFVACVGAPVIEETMFRGVLYRHLRDTTAAWRIGTSVVFSATINSFVFAVIHPQGFVAVPALMALALGFSLAREWRGSLLAPMTAHATNNFLLTMLMLAIL
jgi:membrane protease YdiL (CAAX protease family)